MNVPKIELVESSFQLVKADADIAAELFYSKLFLLDPELKPLFKGDMKSQGQKLMTMIGAAVAGLRDLQKIVPIVQELGKRHAGYGVTAEMYDTVGAALIDTLKTALGDAFSAKHEEAWIEVYQLLAITMKEAAYKEVMN